MHLGQQQLIAKSLGTVEKIDGNKKICENKTHLLASRPIEWLYLRSHEIISSSS